MESKHHKLARSLRSGPSDHDLKPNATTRDQLNVREHTDWIRTARWTFYYSQYFIAFQSLLNSVTSWFQVSCYLQNGLDWLLNHFGTFSNSVCVET